jgi:hypothetical protein
LKRVVGELQRENTEVNEENLLNIFEKKTSDSEIKRLSELKLKKLREQETTLNHYIELTNMIKTLQYEIQILENQLASQKDEILLLTSNIQVN